MTRRRSVIALSVLLLGAPSAARAHLVSSGLGPFYDGALHLLLSPEDLLAVLGVTLLAGLGGKTAARWLIIALPLAWLGAGVVGLDREVIPIEPWLNVALLTMLGVLVAANLRLSPTIIAALGILVGVIHGLDNGAALAAAGAGPTALGGVAATVLILALLVAALVASLRAAWSLIAVRVVGSWIAAVGMLLIGWMLSAAA